MNRKTYILALLSLFFCGCEEFFEPSLENQKLTLLAPADGLQASVYRQTFWWEKQAGALSYKLEVVSPSFDSVATLALDTLVNGDRFVFTLDPGKYQWRVRAENGSSHTTYSSRDLTIYPSSLTSQQVQLATPADNAYLNSPQVRYNWLNLFGADHYRIQVDVNGFLDEQNLIANELTDKLSFVHVPYRDGIYQFRVRAESGSENSKWSPVRTFTYDTTAPEKPALASPADKQVLSKPVKLSWEKVSGAAKYELYLYKGESATLYSSSYPQSIAALEYSFNAGEPGELLTWKIRAVDKAGNAGPFSDSRSFIIQYQ